MQRRQILLKRLQFPLHESYSLKKDQDIVSRVCLIINYNVIFFNVYASYTFLLVAADNYLSQSHIKPLKTFKNQKSRYSTVNFPELQGLKLVKTNNLLMKLVSLKPFSA